VHGVGAGVGGVIDLQQRFHPAPRALRGGRRQVRCVVGATALPARAGQGRADRGDKSFLRQISLRITRWPSQFTTPRTSEESNATSVDATPLHPLHLSTVAVVGVFFRDPYREGRARKFLRKLFSVRLGYMGSAASTPDPKPRASAPQKRSRGR
jgi:hypothetical protein